MKKKTDLEIAAILDQHIRFTTGYADSKLVRERTRILNYYDGIAPAPTHAGNSRFVSQDVFESVEAAKATLLEVFSTNQSIIEFSPSTANDVEAARIATEYCSYIIFRQNDGLTVLDEVIEDGLLARVGICQFSWEDEEEYVEQAIGPADMDTLAAHPVIGHPDTEVNSVDDHQDGTYTANVTAKKNRGCVRIEAVPPEDFGITARAKSIKTAKLVYRREAKTRGELLAMGYSASAIDEIQADVSEMMLDQEKAARTYQTDEQFVLTDDTQSLDDDSKTYTVYHCYAMLDIDGTGIPKLWYVLKVGHTILDKRRVSMKPFAIFDPIHKAHSFYGSSFANKVVPIQNARTVLTRAILDHTVITTSPRWQVVKGGLMNPKELMDNRVGGLVNVTRQDAVTPLLQQPLNPFVFQTIQMLDQTKEDTTGMSRLSKGLNRDAISTQNSSRLIEDLVALSDRRMKLIARRFSQFLRDLYIGVYQLVLDHQDYEVGLEVAGNWVNVDPRQWRERTMVTVDIKVGYGEQNQEAEDLVLIDKYLSQAHPDLYTTQNKFNVLAKALMKKGYKDVTTYITPPQNVPPPQPNPLMMAEVQLKQAQAKAAELSAQVDMLRIQFEREKWNHEFVLKAKAENDAHAVKAAAQSLKERSEIHREMVDTAEIDLQYKELQQAAKVQANSLAHPNG